MSGMERIKQANLKYAPELPAFIEFCKPEVIPAAHRRYKLLALPKPKDRGKALDAFEQIRRML